jgi:hypothetical protein
VSLRIVALPIQSQGTITRANVSVDVSSVACFRVVDTVKSVIATENVHTAIDRITQTTLRRVVGRHTLDETLSETDRINLDIREIRHEAGGVVLRGDLAAAGPYERPIGERTFGYPSTCVRRVPSFPTVNRSVDGASSSMGDAPHARGTRASTYVSHRRQWPAQGIRGQGRRRRCRLRRRGG